MRILGIMTLLVLTGCSPSRQETEPRSPGVSDMVGDWSADLQPLNASGVRGEVKLQSALAGTGITVTVSGAPSGGVLPWHIHRGRCGSGGGILGDATAYPPLQPGQDGTARITMTLGTALNEQERYHVNVHRSPTELTVIVACGDLRN
jgi:hypothetical protein